MSSEPPAEDPIGEDARLDALEERLRAARERELERNQPRATGSDASYRLGNRVLAELLGGVLGGLVIGWVIDTFAGTSPWGLLIGLFLGIVVAFRNIFRMAKSPAERLSDDS